LGSRAKLLLRKKRLQEQMLSKADGQLDNLERLVHDLEFSQVEMQVLDGLKTGNEALNKIHQVLSIDEVERIMDDTREAIDKQKVLF
jgi:charged multivesicular body protein 6